MCMMESDVTYGVIIAHHSKSLAYFQKGFGVHFAIRESIDVYLNHTKYECYSVTHCAYLHYCVQQSTYDI